MARSTKDILSQEEIDALTEKLHSEKQRILESYENDLKAGQASSADGAEDIVDQANAAWGREFLFSLSDNERKQMVLIDDAIERMEKGTYGFCLHSGQPIALPRLQAVPWARFTVDVQEKIEKGLLEEDEILAQ
jgi:DnaK suppressor protein